MEDNSIDGIVCRFSGSPTIEGCIIRNNEGVGVRVEVNGSIPTVSNCAIYGNDKGVFSVSYGDVILYNNTIVDNISYGVRCYRGGEAVISNCIIWDCNDDLDGCSATYSCIEDGDAGTGNISSDPNFADANNDDYRLTAGSGCIDAANGDVAPSADMFGQTRIDDPGMPNTGTGDPNYVDIGAHEFDPNS